MSNQADSLLSTVRDLEVITKEIAELRDAVASHLQAARSLDMVATSLESLAQQLPKLPGEIESHFSGMSSLVSRADTALKPMGSLESSVRVLLARHEQVSEALGEMHGEIRREIGTLTSDMKAQRESIGSLQAHSKELFKLAEECANGISEISRMCKEQFANQSQSNDLIKTRLAKLTGLAKRGFLAILRGKDAPPEPL